MYGVSLRNTVAVTDEVSWDNYRQTPTSSAFRKNTTMPVGAIQESPARMVVFCLFYVFSSWTVEDACPYRYDGVVYNAVNVDAWWLLIVRRAIRESPLRHGGIFY